MSAYEYEDEGEYYDDGGFDSYGYGCADDGAQAGAAAAVAVDGGYQCDEQTLSLNEVLAMQSSVVLEVRGLTCISSSVATLLLCRYSWVREVAIERYFEDSTAVLEQLGITPGLETEEADLCPGSSDAPVECLICGWECKRDEIACLSTCNHYFCTECWRDHIKSRLEENLLATTCPAQHCRNVVGLPIMRSLFDTDQDMTRRILRTYVTKFVEACPNLYWCPNKESCEGILHVPTVPLQGQGVRCMVCQTLYCIRCGTDPHRPATCENMKGWLEFCNKEGSHVAYLQEHTKRCPVCRKSIEKSRGCNYMTCNCGHEFCWICLGSWKCHEGDFYSCRNAENSAGSASAEDVTESKRFVYYYARYTMHLDSAERDKMLISQVQNDPTRRRAAFTELQATGTSRGQQSSTMLKGTSVSDAVTLDFAQIASDVVQRITEALFTARNVLAHSFVAMYYLSPQSSESALMAHRVGKLEEATEALSGSLTRLLLTQRDNLAEYSDAAGVLTSWCRALCDA